MIQYRFKLLPNERLELLAKYIRHGVGEIYIAFEPLAGERYVTVKDDHKAKTWVGVIADLLNGPYRKCLKMTLVCNNLTGPPERCPQAQCVL